MKVAITLLALVASVLASPTPLAEERPLSPFDWSKIEPLDVFVEPIGPEPDASNLPESRVIGGSIVGRNTVPYQCYIIINSASFCGCSLIGRDTILTAAHCTISARTVQIVLGAHSRTQSEATQVVLSASGVVNHPQYNQLGRIENDISLLRVNTQVPLTAAIQLIRLAPANGGTYAGSNAFLSGWGRTNTGSQPNELHGVELQIITNAVCQQSFGASIIASTICTSGLRNNVLVGACNGDSGGPLVVGNVQVGVVSFGAAGCVAGRPTAFARVNSFLDFIATNSGVRP